MARAKDLNYVSYVLYNISVDLMYTKIKFILFLSIVCWFEIH